MGHNEYSMLCWLVHHWLALKYNNSPPNSPLSTTVTHHLPRWTCGILWEKWSITIIIIKSRTWTDLITNLNWSNHCCQQTLLLTKQWTCDELVIIVYHQPWTSTHSSPWSGPRSTPPGFITKKIHQYFRFCRERERRGRASGPGRFDGRWQRPATVVVPYQGPTNEFSWWRWLLGNEQLVTGGKRFNVITHISGELSL